MIVLNVSVDPATYDVNVTPDKRTLLLHDETELCDLICSELDQVFSAVDHCGQDVNMTQDSGQVATQTVQTLLQFERVPRELRHPTHGVAPAPADIPSTHAATLSSSGVLISSA